MRALKMTCAGVIAAAATIAAALPASAATTHATASRSQPSSTVHRGGMYYDPPVAILGSAANGQVRVLLTDGVKISVPATEKSLIMQAILRSKSDGRMAADAKYHQYKDTVRGNCGSSFIEIADKRPGNRPLKMTTGFHVNSPAISYSWATDTWRNAGGFKKLWSASGGLLFREDWSGGFRTILNYRHGVYTGLVYAGSSSAVLSNGNVCVSGGPVVAGYL